MNKKSLLVRAIYVWLGLFALAFVNGALREVGMKKIFGVVEPLAHQLSCLTGIALWTIFVLIVWRRLDIRNMKEAFLIGLSWFIATAFFETFVLNRSLTWTQIFHTYDVAAGEYWGLVLLWIGLMPASIFYILERASSTNKKGMP